MNIQQEEYNYLCKSLEAIMQDENDALANLSNSAALLFQHMKEVNWAGFYLFKENQLVLGPFQGKPACVRIALGRGVCGKAAQEKKPVLVSDVHLFPGHIACDAASESEIVIPIVAKDKLVGVLDIDSDIKARFTEQDLMGLQEYVKILATHIQWESLL